MVSLDNNVHWAVGDVPIEHALQEMSTQGAVAVFVHVDTPHLPPGRYAAAAYDRILRQGWDVAVAALPETVIGKRAGREQFWFVIDGDRSGAEAQGRALIAALQGDSDAGQLVWRVVLSPVTAPWNNAIILAEWLARDKPSPVPTDHHSIFWINGDWRRTERAEVNRVAKATSVDASPLTPTRF